MYEEAGMGEETREDWERESDTERLGLQRGGGGEIAYKTVSGELGS